MKIRNGFVSNSSSSSFVCDFCGHIESGWDSSLSDFDMSECEKGHTFCNDHINKPYEPTRDGIYTELSKYYEDHNKDYKEQIEKFNKRKNNEIELNNWHESRIATNPTYIDSQIEQYQSYIKANNEQLKLLEKRYKDNIEFDDHFMDLFNDLMSERGIPEDYCPVCQRLKEMKKDPDYEKYKELYEKFDKVNPEGCR